MNSIKTPVIKNNKQNRASNKILSFTRKVYIKLFVDAFRGLFLWSTKWSLQSLILMQGLVFLLGLQLAKLIQTSGGLQLEGVKCNSMFGLHETMGTSWQKSVLTRIIYITINRVSWQQKFFCFICIFKSSSP